MKKNCAKDETALPTPESVNKKNKQQKNPKKNKKKKKEKMLTQLVDVIYPIYCRLLISLIPLLTYGSMHVHIPSPRTLQHCQVRQKKSTSLSATISNMRPAHNKSVSASSFTRYSLIITNHMTSRFCL